MELLDFQNTENKFKHLDEVEQEYISYIRSLAENSVYYPRFHLAPPHGLMNDPNGLCQIDGWYHIFYQWFPLGPVHGLKHWYHVKTRDFIHYKDLGPAMFPDTELDCGGCYTGMTVLEHGQWVIYYTGVTEDKTQQVCRAILEEDRIKSKQLCVPHDPNLTTRHFRDPYLYAGQHMLVGAQTTDEKGRVAVYEKIEQKFVFRGFLKLPEELSGYMLECPNMFALSRTEDLFVVSPQGIESPDRFTYRNVFSVVYGVGHFDPEERTFECSSYREMDKGFDFYAPQVFRDEQGRALLMGWLGNSKCVYPSDKEQWAHMMTLPREISCAEGELRQWPVKELTGLRQDSVQLTAEMEISEACFELEFVPDAEFTIRLCNERGEELVFGGNAEEYFLDRSRTSHIYNESYGTVRYAVRNKKHDQIARVYVDRSAIEIFAEDGFVVFTARFYLDNPGKLCCEGIRGEMYNIRPIELLKKGEA